MATINSHGPAVAMVTRHSPGQLRWYRWTGEGQQQTAVPRGRGVYAGAPAGLWRIPPYTRAIYSDCPTPRS